MLFPFAIPFFIPRQWADRIHDALVKARIISSRRHSPKHQQRRVNKQTGQPKRFVRYSFPLNFITAPVIADLFLLAIGAIGRREVKEGTVGSENIKPYDIMIFFITLAYIAISIDASGLIRYLAFKVLQWGGRVGHRLFFYLYLLWAVLSAAVGNDPVILSGTAFLAYMTRVSSNIIHPRAWIHSQFALANIGSAVLVTSNPTNLVLAGAFQIKFIKYTAYMIVPVVLTIIVLFPFLLYIVFQDEALIPQSIKMHDLSEEARAKKPVNPNIPNARGRAEEDQIASASADQTKLLSLEEIMNPFLDKGGAAFGGVVMAATLATVLGINAATTNEKEHFVFYVTLPAAFIMFCWDMAFGWINRHETREIAERGRREVQAARQEKAAREAAAQAENSSSDKTMVQRTVLGGEGSTSADAKDQIELQPVNSNNSPPSHNLPPPTFLVSREEDMVDVKSGKADATMASSGGPLEEALDKEERASGRGDGDDSIGDPDIEQTISHSKKEAVEARRDSSLGAASDSSRSHEREAPASLDSLAQEAHRWAQETFPTPVAVLTHLPFALVPFAFAMFVLVQALVTKGWVPVFAHGWDHWVHKTGTVGAVGGMGFLSVILCNVSSRFGLFRASLES